VLPVSEMFVIPIEIVLNSSIELLYFFSLKRICCTEKMKNDVFQCPK